MLASARSTERPPEPPRRGLGGTHGNERLTAEVGAVLSVVLAALGLTIPLVHSLIREHVFLGMLLIPVVLLKMASTGYRFVRYYTNDPAYRAAGPPRPLLRAIAPLVVLSTVVVFASGVLLLVVGVRNGPVGLVHKASFIVWFGVTAIHVLAYVRRVPRLASADFRAASEQIGGSFARRAAVGAALAAGLVLAAATVQYA